MKYLDDRDINAGQNLKNEAIRLLTVGTTGLDKLEADRLPYLGISHFKRPVKVLSGE